MIPATDSRSEERRPRDEAIAAEAELPPLELPVDAVPIAMEPHRAKRRPLAVAGMVANGLVRPLDPMVKLTEHARVIILASEGTSGGAGRLGAVVEE